MTDSVKLCLDLREMPDDARREVEVFHNRTQDKRWKFVSERYSKAIPAVSPMSGTGMELFTYWDGSGDQFLQSQTVTDLNGPNALKGQNGEHGTSVFAAGVAGLYLLKHRMACDGVPGFALDMLTTHHVSLHGATVTYLITYETEEETRVRVLQMKAALRMLGYEPTGNDSTNETFTLKRNGYTLKVYHKTDFGHCVFADEEVAEIIKARARCIIRIEVEMQGHYLRQRGWDALESWRHAYAEGRYETIFRELVRSLFHLETVRKGVIRPGVILRHKAPRKEAMESLTDTERTIVLDYLAGTPVDELPAIRTAKAPDTAKNKWKTSILKKLRIDISISWTDHQALKHAELNRLVRYPGDYHPDAVTVECCFCKENWPKLLECLKALCRNAVARQSSA